MVDKRAFVPSYCVNGADFKRDDEFSLLKRKAGLSLGKISIRSMDKLYSASEPFISTALPYAVHNHQSEGQT